MKNTTNISAQNLLLYYMKLLVMMWEHLSHERLAQYSDHKILFIESYFECSVHKHHKKKLVFYISAMRHFYHEIQDSYDAEYIKSEKSLIDIVSDYIKSHDVSEVHMIRPGEYKYYDEMQKLCNILNTEFIMDEDNKFICSIDEFKVWSGRYKGKLLMENFYRFMRTKTGLLMKNGKPVGDKWNFDKENRKSIPKNLSVPNLRQNNHSIITQEAVELVETRFSDHFGDIDPFYLEVTQAGAEQVWQNFLTNSLANFGQYQDAMKNDEELLFHSSISAYLNIGLLDPMKICRDVEQYYNDGKVSVQSAEGFIRQVLGWREFIRGIYWTQMPAYKNKNHLNYQNPLPWFYWDTDTDCACLKAAITHTKKYAYSHHIQRLMITGNFAALIGVRPSEICEWYLCVYADAYEWVELPNTLGMATYADGGIVGTKPYIASGNYINKMSDFCKGCKYDCTLKVGPKACPFNYLYWNFLMQHKIDNPRMSIMYKVLERMPDKDQIMLSSSNFINKILYKK